MDRVKLFTLLVAIASVHITAEGAKKKIRIHLPQKVKHIHHHKKIYITNHPASSQYAPAYLPSAEGTVAMPTNVALPAVANIVPFNSLELYDESQSRVPRVTPAASKLLPMYRARGYYGPKPSEWEDDYDLAPPPEPNDSYQPSAYSAPSSAAASNYPPKRLKVIKVNEVPRKKVVRKVKPKRVIVRGRPQPEDEHPVSSFHEQFYSDLQGSGTLRKVKKPQRVEKIIDGDTEHIHTYSEEHIHKLVYNDGSKVDPVGSMSALNADHSLLPIKSTQALLAIPSNSLTALGSMGTPSHLEFAGYNARDVTHDHIFHDHGEIPADVDITKNALGIPPKVSYNSQGLRISSGLKRPKHNKYPLKYSRPTKATGDLSYYESIYTPLTQPRKIQRPTKQTSLFDDAPEPSFRPLPSFNFNKAHSKLRGIQNQYNKNKLSEFRSPQASVPAPFSVSNTVVHDYPQNNYAEAQSSPVGLSKFKEPFANFEYEPYAAPTSLYHSDDESENQYVQYQGKKGKKKSYSTQNIRFGGRDLQTFVDHLIDPNGQPSATNDDTPSALDNLSSFDDPKQSEGAEPTGSTAYTESTAFTIRETSPAHTYYSAMAVKALQGDQISVPEASNDNYHYVEPPAPTTTPFIASTATTTEFYDARSTDVEPTQPTEYIPEKRPTKRHRQSEKVEHSGFENANQETRPRYPMQPFKEFKQNRHLAGRKLRHHERITSQLQSDPNLRGNLKYGDKI